MHKSKSSPQVIHVNGNHYQMGLQHAKQVIHLKPAIHAAIDERYEQLALDGVDNAFETIVQATIALLHDHDSDILDMIRGLAEGLEISFDRLLHYNLATFLRDILTTRKTLQGQKGTNTLEEGCSTWAATGATTIDGHPIIVKNRDFSLKHLPLQLLVRAKPEKGYRYTYITSAGSPGVFVAGFNETGLAIVDTHVSSTDVGAGLPTYALSMHILEEHSTVRSALDYLKTVPRLGRNNLLLADASGDIALFEIGNQHFSVVEAESDILVNTNHFLSPAMKPSFVDTQSELTRGNSFHRYDFLQKQLEHDSGRISVDFSQQVMATHSDLLSSICRHPTENATSSTISTMIFLPTKRQLYFCHGMPCSYNYTMYDYHET